MKTDRFSDIIRRKLESIRPEFSEKDWARMQASLQTGMPQPASSPTKNPFGGGIWTAKPWLMAAASVGAVAVVSYGFWQQREINQLRQTISELKKPGIHRSHSGQIPASDSEALKTPDKQTPTPSDPENASAGSSSVDAERTIARQQLRDTVYITRYVTVPSTSHLVPPDQDRYADQQETLAGQREQRYASNKRSQTSVAQPNQSDNLPNNPNSDAYGEPSTTSSLTSENLASPSAASEKLTGKTTRDRRLNSSYRATPGIAAGQNFSGNSYSTNYRNVKKGRNSGSGSITGQTPYYSSPDEGSSQHLEEALTSARFEPVSSLPLAAPTTNWSGLLAQRARRMRSARTTVVGGTAESTKAPESQRIARVGSHFRAGVGGEIASKLTGVGVVTEVLVGKRWAVSAGISQVSYTGDKFQNDFEFDVRMRRDFRKEFAHTIDPRRDIFNIATRTTRWQAPISVSYRIPLSRTLLFTPMVGTYVNLSSTEEATFYCPVPIPQRGFEELSYSDKRTVPLLSSFALGAGVEWQQGHWVLQGSPVLTIPAKETQEPFQPNQNWQSSTLVGLRARLLYQF